MKINKELMKMLTLIFLGIILQGCIVTDRGIKIEFPNPEVNVCLNAVSDDEIEAMTTKIKREIFKDDKLKKAKYLSRDRCFLARQVIIIMDAFTFESDKLEIAKFLYTKTEDQHNFEIVIDHLTYRSDKDKLRSHIDSM